MKRIIFGLFLLSAQAAAADCYYGDLICAETAACRDAHGDFDPSCVQLAGCYLAQEQIQASYADAISQVYAAEQEHRRLVSLVKRLKTRVKYLNNKGA